MASERSPLLGPAPAAPPRPGRRGGGPALLALLAVACALYAVLDPTADADPSGPALAVKGSTTMGFMILSVEGREVAKAPNVRELRVKIFALDAVTSLNEQRTAQCLGGAAEPFDHDDVEVFHAWTAAETGEVVAVAAELGSNKLVGLLKRGGAGAAAYRAFNLRDQGLPDLDVCGIPLSLGSRVDLVSCRSCSCSCKVRTTTT